MKIQVWAKNNVLNGVAVFVIVAFIASLSKSYMDVHALNIKVENNKQKIKAVEKQNNQVAIGVIKSRLDQIQIDIRWLRDNIFK